MNTTIYLSDLIRRQNAISADARHDIDGWKIRLFLAGGRVINITLARHTRLILDTDYGFIT